MNLDKALCEGVQLANKIGIANIDAEALAHHLGIPRGSLRYKIGCSFTEFYEELKKLVPFDPSHLITRARVDPEFQKARLLHVAVKVATSEGVGAVTRERVAEVAGVAPGVVQRCFGPMENLRGAVLERLDQGK